MEQELKEAIIKTMAYFDIFDFPLKREEIWQWMYFEKCQGILGSLDFLGFLEVLGVLEREGIIEEKEGYYFFAGRENILKIREQRREISLRKIKKAERLVRWWLQKIPWIKAVFLANNVSYLNATADSDIDLFIITQKNRLWLARFLAVLPLKILNLRPTEKIKKDRFCLSYFISEDNLNLEKYGAQNEFSILIYWSVFYLPLYEKDNLWPRFLQENKWTQKFLPNIKLGDFREVGHAQSIKMEHVRGGKNSRIGDWAECCLRKFQIWYLPDKLKKIINLDNTLVAINNKVIKFHIRGKREEIYLKWKERVEKIDVG